MCVIVRVTGSEIFSHRKLISWLYLFCQISEVLLCVADHVSHSEDGAVGVVDHVKVTFFDVIVSDASTEVPSAHMQTETSSSASPSSSSSASSY